jgi:hypothetical protein
VCGLRKVILRPTFHGEGIQHSLCQVDEAASFERNGLNAMG